MTDAKTNGDSGPESSVKAEPFPRGTDLPPQSPLFWVQQKDRYLRQLLIRDIEAQTGRRLVVYYANRSESAMIDGSDPGYVVELLGDVASQPVDVLLETSGGQTDATEHVVSVLEAMAPDLRVIVVNAAKSNGTVICLTGKSIVMGASSELGPIEPQLGGIPCTILSTPEIAKENYVLNQLGQHALNQTRKLATRLLTKGMMSGRPQDGISKAVETLLTRDVYFSHGSVIDYREAIQLGLAVDYLPPDNDLWCRLHLLLCMYDSDCQKNDYLKVFEGRARSAAIAVTRSQSPLSQTPAQT